MIRRGFLTILIVSAVLHCPHRAEAQHRRFTVYEQAGIQCGFRGHGFLEGYKEGLWMPVLVKLVEDSQGRIVLPVGDDKSLSGEISVETPDSDGVFTTYTRKFSLPPNGPFHVVAYTKPASANAQIRVTIKASNDSVTVNHYGQGIEQARHLYVALGDNLLSFHEALLRWQNQFGGGGFNPQDSGMRQVAYETDAQNLPDRWFGYNGVDVVILVGSNEKFLERLIGNRQSTDQLDALAEWVRRGGRLVVSIDPLTRDKVHRLLTSPAWKPALPAALPLDSKIIPLGEVSDLRNWSSIDGNLVLFKKGKEEKPPVRQGVRLQESPTVAVGCRGGEGKDISPLIVRFPHGMGSITLLGFNVRDAFLDDWKDSFWKAFVTRLGPSAGGQQFAGFQLGRLKDGGGLDVTSRLYEELEKHDTPTIAFGWVVFFIFIYILVVGPLDYVILKFVLKRLEFTWITFPLVVITISLAAYFTAYWVKGEDLKVNKVDLVDIDLYSGFAEGRTVAPSAFGTTWFSIRSPRIQNYTIGLEPALQYWQPDASKVPEVGEPVMSWLGRPEHGNFGGRGRAPGLFTGSYSYADNATGVRDVPIPVWSTRSFTVSWDSAFAVGAMPIESALIYDSARPTGSATGMLKNNLPFKLVETALIYRGQVYHIGEIDTGATFDLKATGVQRDLSAWVTPILFELTPKLNWDGRKGTTQLFNAALTMRGLMFSERMEGVLNLSRNMAHRPLDWSWRMNNRWALNADLGEAKTREAYLVARVGQVTGAMEQLHDKNNPGLASQLWFGKLPGEGRRPRHEGTLFQDTYLRVILPVTPKK